jgi:hypothetical protein
VNAIMRHLLLLVAAVLLAPPGWCCKVPLRTQHNSHVLAKAEPCCPACATPVPSEKQDEDHSVPPQTWCCCEPATLPSTDRVAADALDFTPAFTPPIAAADVLTGRSPPPVEAPPPPLRPLHVLCSVWLC